MWAVQNLKCCGASYYAGYLEFLPKSLRVVDRVLANKNMLFFEKLRNITLVLIS